MRKVEFYIYEDELWCLRPDGTNDRVAERDSSLVKDALNVIKHAELK